MSKHKPKAHLWSVCLGNLFEHYDAALFSFLSPFLAPLIFPEKEPITALILTYAMIPLGMLARPLGSLFFGYVGDVYGRRSALFWALGGMALISGCIALSPTYAQAGILAPLIFCAGRIAQNFLAAGETMGGAIFLLENASERRHDLLSSFYNVSTLAGLVLASAGVALLCYFKVTSEGWRLLYILGCGTALFGFLLRRHMPTDTQSIATRTLKDHIKTFWTYKNALCSIALSSGLAYANYTMALVVMNGFIPLISSLTKAEMLNLNTLLLIFDLCTLPLFGWLSSKISRKSLMLGASICIAVGSAPLCMLLGKTNFVGIIGIRMFFVLCGVAFFAPFHAWASQLVPKEHRYTLISFGYAIGSQLFGGPTAALSLWLFKTTGHIEAISWYWILLALTTSLVLAKPWKRAEAL